MKVTKVLGAAFIAGAAMIANAASAATPITYTGTQQIGGITANYSIETDGSLGQLSGSNISYFDVSLIDGSQHFEFNSNSGSASGPFIATSTNLYAPPSISGLSFRSNSLTNGVDDANLNFQYSSSRAQIALDSQIAIEPNILAFAYASAVPEPAVPEPASWAMMILGMGSVGYMMRRRKAVTTRVKFA